MTSGDSFSLLAIMSAAIGAVLLQSATRRLRIPIVVIEIAVGIVVGPQLLGVVQITPLVALGAKIGVACLFFLVGFEVDLSCLGGRSLRLGVLGWAVSLGIATGIGLVLHAAGLVGFAFPFALAISTTALGMLLPLLRDDGMLATSFGQFALGAGIAGEFGPIVCLAVVFSDRPGTASLMLALFVAVCAAVAILTVRLSAQRLTRLFRETARTSGQLPIRFCVLLLAVTVFCATQLGLDMLLGAFTAGLIVRLAASPSAASQLRAQLDAVGFGLFIPIFFIVTGARFDLRALTSSPFVPLAVSGLVLAFVTVRGAPALLYGRAIGVREKLGLACLCGTQLPLTVVITTAAVAAHQMTPATASTLVTAGMASVLFLPLLGLRLLQAGTALPSQHAQFTTLPFASTARLRSCQPITQSMDRRKHEPGNDRPRASLRRGDDAGAAGPSAGHAATAHARNPRGRRNR